MPDISLPEVRLPDFKLPEGLRDVSREDIQKSMPDVKLPKIDLPKRKDISRELAKATKELEKAGRDLEKNLPRRPAPSPLPFVIFGMLSGLVVGWLLASSPTTGPRISSLVDELKGRVDRWRSAANGASDNDPAAYRDATYAGAMSEAQAGVGVGPGDLGNGIGTTPQSVGSDRT
jgi:hypothetical protein